jgi:hypothetical protein
MTYHDFAGREVEDLEMENMRQDARRAAKLQEVRQAVNLLVDLAIPIRLGNVKMVLKRYSDHRYTDDEIEALMKERAEAEQQQIAVHCANCDQLVPVQATQEGGALGWTRYSYECSCGHCEADISIEQPQQRSIH